MIARAAQALPEWRAEACGTNKRASPVAAMNRFILVITAGLAPANWANGRKQEARRAYVNRVKSAGLGGLFHMEKVQRTAGARLQAVDQAENRGVQPDPQRQRDHRQQSETGRLE